MRRRSRPVPWAAAWRACCSIAARCCRASSTASTRADWNPATDRHLPAQYDAATVALGKAACKAALQKELGLPQAAGVPLVATVGRLDDQKGFDLIAEVMQRWVQTSDVQWVIFGTGQPKYHKLFEGLAQRYPKRSPCGWSSPTPWPTASRPAATFSSCPAASSPAA